MFKGLAHGASNLVVTDYDALKPFYTGHSSLYVAAHLKAWLPATK